MTDRGNSRILLLLIAAECMFGAGLAPGLNKVELRGKAQDVHFIPGSGAGVHDSVLYTPGDGGWRGTAVTMASRIATWGYDVYAWDTKQYLTAFTNGNRTLSESEIARDFAAMPGLLGVHQKITLVGWSQGAAMSLLAAARDRSPFKAVVAIGLPERAVLGWRWADNITYVTKKEPDEPFFNTRSLMPEVSPLPLAVIHAENDEYTPASALRDLFVHAGEPKTLTFVAGSTHNFSRHEDDFFAALRRSLDWCRAQIR